MAGLRTEKPSNETINETPATEVPEGFPFDPTPTMPVVQEPVAAPPSTVVVGAMESLASLEDKWNPYEVGNVFPRLKASSGSINGDNINLGDCIDMQVYSYNTRYFVVPGKHSDPKIPDSEGHKLCRASYDGKTINDRDTGDNVPIPEYMDELREQGYPNPKMSEYTDIYGIIFNSAKDKAKAFDKGIVQVAIAPTSRSGFFAYTKQTKLMMLRGQIPADKGTCVRIMAEPVSNKKGDYTKTNFGPVPLDVIASYTPIYE